MEMYKIRLTVLYLLAIVALFGYRTLALSEPSDVLSNISLVTDVEVASITVVLLVFAVLSLVLKGSTNRLTNMIAGAVLGLGTFIALVDGITVKLSGVFNVMMAAFVIMMVLVIWFAHNMPKSEA